MSFLDKFFGRSEPESDESDVETHEMSADDLSRGKQKGSVKGDPIIEFG